MTEKINKINSGNKKNFNNTTNSSADTNITKSRSVQIYHADAKPVLYALAFNAVALAIIAVGVILAIVNVKQDISAVDNKVAGVIIGLSTNR